jgi:hypothetical protein
MNTPQRRQIALPVLAMVAALAVLLPAWVPVLRAAPWDCIVTAVQAVLSVAMVVYLVRWENGHQPFPQGGSGIP